MVAPGMIECLKNHVLLDVVRFLTANEVLRLTMCAKPLRDVLDQQWDVWHHCVSVNPILIRNFRRLREQSRSLVNRHFCVWHLHMWQKIVTASTFNYLLCSSASYSFATGLVCTAFRRIAELSEGEQLRYSAHKMQLHIMISQHLLNTQLEDVDEVVAGLHAIRVLARPFNEITVSPDLFLGNTNSSHNLNQANNSNNNLSNLVNNSMPPADCAMKALHVHQSDPVVVECALQACINMAVRRSYALFIASEGFVSLLMHIICTNGPIIPSNTTVIAAVNALRNVYDPLNVTMDHLDQIIVLVLFILRTRRDREVVSESVAFLSHLAVWQAVHMQSTELSETLVDVISVSDSYETNLLAAVVSGTCAGTVTGADVSAGPLGVTTGLLPVSLSGTARALLTMISAQA